MRSVWHQCRQAVTFKVALLGLVAGICASVVFFILDANGIVRIETMLLVASILFFVFLCGLVASVIVDHKRALLMETRNPEVAASAAPQEKIVYHEEGLVATAQTGRIDLPNPRDLD